MLRNSFQTLLSNQSKNSKIRIQSDAKRKDLINFSRLSMMPLSAEDILQLRVVVTVRMATERLFVRLKLAHKTKMTSIR